MRGTSLTLPPALRRHGKVGIVAPSFPTAAMFPIRLSHAVDQLATVFEVGVEIAPHVTAPATGFEAGSVATRAAELNAFIADPAIDAIFCAIGGFNSAELLPLLDFESARRRAKIFVGYSDCTAVLHGLYAKANWITFHGPAVMTQFGEYPRVFPFTVDSLRRALCGGLKSTRLEDPAFWTIERLEWAGDEWRSRARKPSGDSGREIWRSGRGQGQLWGGNLETLNLLAGTSFFDPPESLVLFWEVVEAEAYLPRVQRALTHLKQLGVFERTRAMLIGRSPDATSVNGVTLQEVVAEVTSSYDFPVVGELAIGHTDPMATLPIGVNVRVNAASRNATIEFMEEAVQTANDPGVSGHAEA